ncbi:DUF502 domain-containing protein [Hypnocyclicus thermotrophus]|uniref:DUF502 domain-containing protein n=1 Tax=Hypnocyclicus thermotrophus TaxID=1627895 RepID=UPI001416F32C|nr:DUF502 domain-containing protein [Hypnocyclicus thermotrophus]
MNNKIRNNLKKYFIAGIIATLPLFATIYILSFIFKLTIHTVTQILPMQYLVDIFLENDIGINIDFIKYFLSNFLSLALVFFIIYIIGLLVSHFINYERINYFENVFLKLPLVKPIYSTFKQFNNILFSKDFKSYKKVVLVEYPRKGIYSIGFLTNNKGFFDNEHINKNELCSVFIPTSPNPTSGMFIMTKVEEVIFLNMKIEDAFKLIISGGAIYPEELITTYKEVKITKDEL